MAGHRRENRLFSLLEMEEFYIPEDQPNVLGWVVRDKHGRRIGRVGDLIFDPDSGIAVYADVSLEYKPGSVKHFLVPMDFLEIEEEHKRLIWKNAEREHIVECPVHQPEDKQRDRRFERELYRYFTDGTCEDTGVAEFEELRKQDEDESR